MTKQPRQARRTALRLLYAADVGDDSPEEILGSSRETIDELNGRVDWELVERRVRGVADRRDFIDEQIRELSPNWRIDRMAAVDRNLLRLGIYEILEEITPPLIAINACVELAKEFGTASTPGFINGLLDQLCQNHGISIEATSSSAPNGGD